MTDEPTPTQGTALAVSSPRRRVGPKTRLALGLLVSAIAVWMVVSTAGGIGDAFGAISRMRGTFVLVAVAVAATRLALYGVQLTVLGRRSGPLRFRTGLGLGLVVYGFGAVMPAAPAEGFIVATRELRRRGRSPRHASLTLGFSEWFAQRTFYAIAAVDLLAVVALGHLKFDDSWPFMSAALLVLAALAASALVARRRTTAERVFALIDALHFRTPRTVERKAERRRAADVWHADAMQLLGGPRRRIRIAAISACAVLADAATLWATCHATGFHMKPELALLASTVGTMASWVPFLPGGLGLVEAAIPAMLHRFGAPFTAAFAATVVYRAVGTLLPAFAGGAAIALLRLNGGPIDSVADEPK